MKIPRQWQSDFQDQAAEKVKAGQQDYFVYAGVASGKTFASLIYGKVMLTERRIDRIVVVTYTTHLVYQWGTEATSLGLRLRQAKGNKELRDGLPDDVDGYVMTYAMMGLWPDLHAAFCADHRTLVIFDEIHHLGDFRDDRTGASTWTIAAKTAFSDAAFRLGLSGTPIRSDQRPIPWGNYEQAEDGLWELHPDTTYTYAQSVADGICRRVYFPSYDGTVKFKDDDDGIEYSVTFKDKLNDVLESRRLWFANEPSEDNLLLKKLLTKANKALTRLRNHGHPRAGGLIIARDIAHAIALKEFFTRLTGCTPRIVHSETIDSDEKAHKLIARFEKSSEPWLICVKMVTEGVDIKRLRVLAYCSNVTEELFFLQVMGRIVRFMLGHPGNSYFFMPADSRLCAIARKVEAEIRLALKKRRGGGGGPGGPFKDFSFISTTGEEGTTYVAGIEVPCDIAEAVRTFLMKHPELASSLTPSQICDLIRAAREPDEPDAETASSTYDEDNRTTRTNLGIRLKYYCRLTEKEYGVEWNKLKDEVGCGGVLASATDEQLDEMAKIVERKIEVWNSQKLRGVSSTVIG